MSLFERLCLRLVAGVRILDPLQTKRGRPKQVRP